MRTTPTPSGLDPRQQLERAARKLGRHHHWRLARMNADTVTDTMLQGWFQELLIEGERLPMCPRRRMIWLVVVRASFRAAADPPSVLMVSAALLREANRLRRLNAARRRMARVDNARRTAMVSGADGPRKGITGNSVPAARQIPACPSPKLPPQL